MGRYPSLHVDAPLVAECEWGNKGGIEDDFEKLLLARTCVRLMIFEGISKRIPKPRSEEVADRLAGMVRRFNGSRAEDAWMLAVWERNDDEEKGWSFSYFTIERNTSIPMARAGKNEPSTLSLGVPVLVVKRGLEVFPDRTEMHKPIANRIDAAIPFRNA